MWLIFYALITLRCCQSTPFTSIIICVQIKLVSVVFYAVDINGSCIYNSNIKNYFSVQACLCNYVMHATSYMYNNKVLVLPVPSSWHLSRIIPHFLHKKLEISSVRLTNFSSLKQSSIGGEVFKFTDIYDSFLCNVVQQILLYS
jgi:hypothetical protein